MTRINYSPVSYRRQNNSSDGAAQGDQGAPTGRFFGTRGPSGVMSFGGNPQVLAAMQLFTQMMTQMASMMQAFGLDIRKILPNMSLGNLPQPDQLPSRQPPPNLSPGNMPALPHQPRNGRKGNFPGQPTTPGQPGQQPQGAGYKARGTGYYPHNSRMEGGYKDRKGNRLYTLQDYLAGNAPYVSVAMDSKAFRYNTPVRIPELEKKYGRPIDFRVVDTGGAFKGKGTSRIDICTKSRQASLDPTINGPLTIIPRRI